MTRRAAVLACCLAAMPATAAPAGEAVRIEHNDPAKTPAKGPVNALVTVEIFFAPSIDAARRFPAYRQLEALQAKHPTRVRLVYRIIRRGAQPPGPQLPTLALEAYTQGKFYELLALVHAQRTTMTRDQMLDLAKKAGVDPGRADRAIAEDRYGEILDTNERRLERLHGTSAPMVFFNGRPLASAISSLRDETLEAAYAEALDRAKDMLDRGFAQKDLPHAFDLVAKQQVNDVIVLTRSDEEPYDRQVVDHPLASPPLALAGMPSLGRAGASGAGVVVVLCRPTDERCNVLIRIAPRLSKIYRGDVRVVWAPWFDVLTRDDATELALLGDAALCAEQIASSPDDLDTSPGWLWVTELMAQAGTSRGRSLSADGLIDSVAERVGVGHGALSACRARMAGTTLDFIEAARHAGVTRSPAIVIGGRIYEGLDDQAVIQALVEAELAPGVLGRCATTGC